MSKDQLMKRLENLDRGARANLRKALRCENLEDAYWIWREIGDIKELRRDAAFIVAPLYCATYTDPEEHVQRGRSLAESVAVAIKTRGLWDNKHPHKRSSLENRFLHLLDMEPKEMVPTLHSLLSILKTESLNPDFGRLYADLSYWGSDKRRQWGKDFYQALTRSENIKLKNESGEELTHATA